jgi:hypothetical protein
MKTFHQVTAGLILILISGLFSCGCATTDGKFKGRIVKTSGDPFGEIGSHELQDPKTKTAPSHHYQINF